MSSVEDVKTLKTVHGEEIISAEVSIDASELGKQKYKIRAPMLLGLSPNGQPTLVPYIFTSGYPKDIYISYLTDSVTYVGPTDPDIAKDYLKMTKLGDQIITQEKKIITSL